MNDSSAGAVKDSVGPGAVKGCPTDERGGDAEGSRGVAEKKID